MKIAHVIDSLDVGGMERLVVDLVKLQKKQGHEVSVYCIRFAGDLTKELEDSGVCVHVFNKKDGFNIRLIFSLASLFKQEKLDVIHTHNPLANYYSAIASRLSNIKTVINTRHGMGNAPYSRKREFIFKLSTFFTKKVAFVCRKAKKRFNQMRIVSPKKSVVVYNGIDLDKFKKIDEEEYIKVRDEFGIAHNIKIVGTVARLEKPKDIQTLIMAAKSIIGGEIPVKFMIVGDGSQRKNLIRLADKLEISNHVIFLGKRNDVSRLLKAFDIFVLPSLSEGMSLTLIESMAAGNFTISTDVGGSPEVICDGESGMLIKPGQYEKIAMLVNQALNDEISIDDFGKKAKDRSFKLFDIKRMARDYEELYSQAIN